jgi:hypothetical protein
MGDGRGDVRGLDAGKEVNALGGDAEGVVAGEVFHTPHLGHVQPAHVLHALLGIGEVEDSVRHREDGLAHSLLVPVPLVAGVQPDRCLRRRDAGVSR